MLRSLLSGLLFLLLVASGVHAQDSVAGVYLMQFDGVTVMYLQDNGRYVYEDPIYVYEGPYTVSGDSVVLDFSGLGWYRGEALTCRVGAGGLSCDDNSLYQPWDESFSGRVYGKYYDTNEGLTTLSLQRGDMFIFTSPTGIFESRYAHETGKVTLNFVDGQQLFDGNFVVCSQSPGLLECDNGISYQREY